jgi:predicted nuclease of predicted toxin-antitoxin system
MRFLVDECTGPTVAESLRAKGHSVFSVYEEARGLSDDEIIEKAFDENWIIITNDKDFGEKIFRKHQPNHGIILLRLEDERAQNKIAILEKVLSLYPDRITDHYMVVSERKVRIIDKP